MKKKLQTLWKYTKRTLLALWLSHLLTVILYKYINPPTNPHQLYTRLSNLTSPLPFSAPWLPFDSLSNNIKLAVISSEDQLFPTHHGFDWNNIQAAINHNSTGPIRGASTISQQVAKNVFLWHGRNLLRKALEAYTTLLIETIWSKKRILEVYINIAQTGPNNFGAQAGAQLHYGHSATSLTQTEAAQLAAILPNPIQYQPNTKYIKARAKHIITQMNNLSASTPVKELLNN